MDNQVRVIFAMLLLVSSIALAIAKIYDRCELARELIDQHKIQRKDIADWICLIQHESEFKTDAIGRLNADGSLDYGLFQISGKHWCNKDGNDGACGINCEDLTNEDIKDDAVCARRIFRAHSRNGKSGFEAWVAWNQHCSGRDLKSYVEDCGL